LFLIFKFVFNHIFSDENYIDLDRMLAEKAGKFRLDSYNMHDGAGDGSLISTRIHKYDFSDPTVIEVNFFSLNFFFNKMKFRKLKIVVQKIH
jgi:hypothetical protein